MTQSYIHIHIHFLPLLLLLLLLPLRLLLLPLLGWGQIAAAAASLHHSHSNTGSKPSLRPTPQLTATLEQSQESNPLCEARDQTLVLLDSSWVCYQGASLATPVIPFLLFRGTSIFFPIGDEPLLFFLIGKKPQDRNVCLCSA